MKSTSAAALSALFFAPSIALAEVVEPISGSADSSTVTVEADGTSFTITGSSGVEYLEVSDTDGDGTHTLVDGLAGVTWVLENAEAIVMHLGAGGDTAYAQDASIGVEINGEGGRDTIYGSAQADILTGGNGADTIYGQAGGDVIEGDSGSDTLVGNGGRDTIHGGSGSDTIEGGNGADSIQGGNGNDSIFGGNGGDTIQGNGGADTIGGGGVGDDALYGHSITSCGTTTDTVEDSEGDNLVRAYPDECDADGDGYTTTDCDDDDRNVHPDATEVCDSIDNDCDDEVDEDDAADATAWTIDDDDDGYGDVSGESVTACEQPSGYVADSTDCDDTDDTTHPGATELCDGLDNDCDDVVGDTCAWLDSSEADITLSGESSQGEFGGYAFEASGDFNSDGYSDLVVGAQGDDESDFNVGAVYVFSDLASSDTGYVRITGESSNDNFGTRMASGDINGDGYDDLLVSAPNYDTDSTDVGAVFAFYGPISGDMSTADADLMVTGAAGYDNYGTQVVAAYDYNSDGFDDIIVGGTGADQNGMLSGILGIHTDAMSGDTWEDASATVAGDDEMHAAGRSFSPVGDLDGDGNNDLFFGAYGADTAYVVYGPHTGSISAGDADFTIAGESTNSTGSAVASGDFDNDGYIDLITGSSASGGSSRGAVHLFYGPLSSDLTLSDSDAEIAGESIDLLGQHDVAMAVDDVDADGRDDLFIGTGYSDAGAYNTGGAFLFYGDLSGSLTTAHADVVLAGSTSNTYMGRGVEIGDVDGDQGLDLITGSSVVNSYAGEAYIFLNGSF